MAEHVLIFKQTAAQPCGTDALLGWSCFKRYGGAPHFRLHGVDQIGDLTIVASSQAIETGLNLTVAWGPCDPATMPADQLDTIFWSLRPHIIFCPEQPRRPDRWVNGTIGGTPGSLPATAVQAQISRTVDALYPRWATRGGPRPSDWLATALLVRHDVTGLDLGLVELAQLTPDDRLGLVANDPAVRSAVRASDPALPETMAALVRARLDAQARAGVAPEDRAPIYVGEVEALLMPVVFQMSRGDGPAALATLRQDLRRQYLDMGEAVLVHALRVFPHDSPCIEALREAAREMTAATAA